MKYHTGMACGYGQLELLLNEIVAGGYKVQFVTDVLNYGVHEYTVVYYK